MSLSGTLKSFALPDVLRLLATTQKTGCLSVETERGLGTLEFVDGNLTRCISPWSGHDDEPAIVLFEMLCAEDGTFSFDTPDIGSDAYGVPIAVEEVLATAESYLVEWQEILKVVPSGTSQLRLEAERNGQSVTLSADQWRAVVALGAGGSVFDLGASLELGELAARRLARDLFNQGVVTISSETSAENSNIVLQDSSLPQYGEYDANHSVANDAQITGSFGADQDLSDSGWSFDSWSADAPATPNFRSFDDEPEIEFHEASMEVGIPDHFDDSDELTRQLANLSPRAAAAVAAVADAVPTSDSDTPLAQLTEDGDDAVNRGLLLKFLSNIKE